MSDKVNTASDSVNEHAEDAIFAFDISDESLEAAAGAGVFGIYTEFAFCTQVACPGG